MHVFPNGKKYIGITAQALERRFDCGRGYQINPMKRAIKKYGWENVRHELLFNNLDLHTAKPVTVPKQTALSQGSTLILLRFLQNLSIYPQMPQ